MFLNFFTALRAAKVPVSLREYLTLLDVLDQDLADKKVDEFYYLSRACLVKDERHFDRFDQVFARTFQGLETSARGPIAPKFPTSGGESSPSAISSEEERREIEALGWDKLFETPKKRLAEQKERHQGGNKWIGTGGTSPYGAHGYNPEGIRIGQEEEPNFRAGEGVGQARVQGLRRQRGTGRAQHAGGAQALAALCPLGRHRRTRSRRDDIRRPTRATST